MVQKSEIVLNVFYSSTSHWTDNSSWEEVEFSWGFIPREGEFIEIKPGEYVIVRKVIYHLDVIMIYADYRGASA